MSPSWPPQSRGFQARLHPSLADARPPQGGLHVVLQFANVRWCRAGYIFIRLCPDKLYRVQFRRISREILHVQPWLAADELLHFLPLMNGRIVPHQQESSLDVSQQVPQKGDDFISRDVSPMYAGSQLQLAFPGSHDERPDDIDSLMVVQARAQFRCLPTRRPRPLQRRDGGKSALVYEDERGAKVTPLFLYGSSGSEPSAPPLCRRGPARPAGAFGNSSPFAARDARRRSGGSAPQTSARRVVQYGRESNSPLHNHERKRRARAPSPSGQVVLERAAAVDPSPSAGAALMAKQLPAAIFARCVERRRLNWRQPLSADLAEAGEVPFRVGQRVV